MKFNWLFRPLIILVISVIPIITNGQIDPNCDPDCPYVPGCPDECIPFDSGLILLLVAGIAIGAKKAYQNRILKSEV